MKFRSGMAAAALTVITSAPVWANGWALSAAESVVSFGSIKNDYVGEAHTFSGLSGQVSDAGDVSVTIDLASLSTKIDIRDERMAEHVFKNMATADISAKVDLDAIKSLAVGEGMTTEVDAAMMLLGNEVDVFIDAYVLRVGEDKIMVSTNTASYLATEDLGVDAGVDVLQGLAGLDSITRVTPVTLRLMFER